MGRSRVELTRSPSQGLGLAIVHEFLTLGAEVLIVARSSEDLADLCARLEERYPGKAHAAAADVSLEQGRSLVVGKARELWAGCLDILVNNVGTNKRAPVEESPDEDYHQMVRTNQDSAYFMCKLCLPLMRASALVCLRYYSPLCTPHSSFTPSIVSPSRRARLSPPSSPPVPPLISLSLRPDMLSAQRGQHLESRWHPLLWYRGGLRHDKGCPRAHVRSARM
ncbi:MAG: hypothetical protein SGPRY_000453 [Prymnesium sp.]